MDAFLDFIHVNKGYFEMAQALSSFFNVVGWTLGGMILVFAWRRKGISSVSLGPLNFQMRQQAIEAAATAERDWRARARSPLAGATIERERTPGSRLDLDRIRATVGKAFDPDTADNLIGKSILWVDDNPSNNTLALRALTKLQVDVEQATSTELGLAAMARRHFDLVISDMGRGGDMRAGYGLLKAIRAQGNTVPFFIFSSGDSPQFRADASKAGAQLSTNDMLELIDAIIKTLGKA